MSTLSAPTPGPGDWDYREFAPVPFARFREELLSLYLPPLRARKTFVTMRQVLNVVAGLVGDDATTAALTPGLVAAFIGSRPDGEASLTTYNLVSYLRSACSYAKSRGYIRTSPFDFRKKWVRVGRPREAVHHSREDIRRVLDLLASEVQSKEDWPRWRARRLLAMASVFAYTGLRRNEALGLHAEDVDLGRRMIFLVEREGSRYKTERSAQPVPIPDALVPVLSDWMAHRLDGRQGTAAPWLFPGVAGRGAWKNGPRGHRPLDQIKAAGERAGVRGLTFLSLRHSFATHAAAWGLTPAMLQRVLRHTSLGTQRHYIHPDFDSMRAAVDGIGFGPPAAPDGPDAERGATP